MLNIRRPTLDAVAVTYGPGLEPALWTGINFARALSTLWEIPLIPINHMEGHIFSALLKAEKNSKFKIQNSKFSDTGDYKLKFMSFPSIALLISGGHTELVLIKNWFEYEIIGQTRDDAVGEAFDKVARMLELPYPGGPEISKLAETARSKKPATSDKQLATRLPRPMLHDNSFDFSFSGLKTAVLYMLKNDIAKSDFTNFKSALACEFQDSVAEVLVAKTMRALQHLGARTLIIGGGVSANAHIGREFEKAIARLAPGTALHVPEVPLTGDNALMIAAAAAARAAQFGLGQYSVNPDILAQGNLRL
jgi:N6-L-threonylcarbamoyladenine synthase